MAAPNSHRSKSRGGLGVSRDSKKSFKGKRKPNEAAQQKSLALHIEDDDVPDFPRGGGSFLSRQEREEIRAEVDEEFAADKRMEKKKRRKDLQKRGRTNDDDLGSLFGDGISGKLPKFANRITFKNLSPGMKVLGVITEVNEKDLVVGLPGNLRGLVRIPDAYDPELDGIEENDSGLLSSMFDVGEFVSCVVLRVDDDSKEKGKRKIWLSLRLSLLHKGITMEAIQEGMVLSARVKSVEDHGYILHFGSPSFSGFMPKDSQGSRVLELKSGKLLQGIIKGIDKTRKVVYLNPNLELASKHVTKDLKGISIDLLVPGMMVNARVKSTLENGVLLSFLTYFTGTVDMFHLEDSLPTRSWSEDYPQNKKVNARILFIDPSSRAVALTLNPYLLQNKAPSVHVKVGDIYEDAKVVRADKGFGLLLEIPSIPESTPAYVGLSDIAEEDARKLEKKFKEGSRVRVRILGFRHLEGLAVGILKIIVSKSALGHWAVPFAGLGSHTYILIVEAAAFEGSVFTHSDVKPGMVVKAKIIAVDSFGAIVQFSGGVKALCPLQHMSEFETTKPRKKFKVGAELVFRVLGCKSKRITVTHKKTMVKSKLTILSSYADATDGLITHGWITKIEKHGCFVRFYNGVQGFAPRSELGLQPGSDPVSMYHVGQVVKCRITSAVPAARRINLSFMMKHASYSEDNEVKIGQILSGVVEGVTPRGICVYFDARGYSKGIIPVEHLADHHEHAVLLSSVLKPEYKFDRLLILDIEGNNLLLSAKNSLISSAHTIPLDLSHVHPNSLVNGYICNLIETGCFVRFLGRLTGFCPKKKATDDQRSDLSEAFFIGQSVRSNILNVDNESGRITLSLKQSCCSSADASLIEGYFLLEEKIAMLQFSNSSGSELKWVEEFKIGGIVKGKIQERKEYGVVVSFGQYNDIFGFITHYQCGRIVDIGADVEAVVLDVAKAERLIDLSLKPEFVDNLKRESLNSHSRKKKRKRESLKDLELHQTVTAVVEIVKENYLVLSLPEYNHAVGYALVYDYNTQKFPQKNFVNGQSVTATVVSLASGSSTGRLLLLPKNVGEVNEKSSSKRAKKKSSINIGSLVQAEVTEIKPLEMRLKFGIGFRGRVYVTDVNDDVLEDPFKNFRVGQTVTARIVERSCMSDTKRNNLWELSLKQSVLAESYKIEEKSKNEDFGFSVGQHVSGYVYKVNSEWAWIAISQHVKAQLFVLDSECDPTELRDFHTKFYVGKTVSGYVLTTNKEKRLLRIVRCPLTTSDRQKDKADEQSTNEDVTAHMHEGSILGGRISKILPGVGGLIVQLGPTVYGRVNFTEINDLWVPDPLSGYQEGQFVRCKVLEISRSGRGTVHIDLSLRSSLDGMCGPRSNDLPQDGFIVSKDFEIGEIQADMVVQGYVKNITSKGCFIMLSWKYDAKICLCNLSDGYIDDPEKEFPVGKLVKGKILSMDPQSKRIEVTLRSSNATKDQKPGIKDFSSLHIGDIVSGYIKRVEPYGLFITIDHRNLVGLCHRSELSDDPLDNIELKYRAGEKVTAKILKVDKERHRIALGMKSSYFLRGNGIKEPLEQVAEHPMRDNGNDSETLIIPSAEGVLGISHMIIEEGNNDSASLAQAESRASVPPLEVALDEIEHFDDDIAATPKHDLSGELDMTDDKSKKRAKKKAKEEREQEIRAAEERLLEKDIPRSPDEFEKLVRSSPNSSFIWIKYMAFMLSLADIEKARSIAERALKTINIREENEKLNIWVAYFNLENEYGNPPEEAVMRVFQRALQYCDHKNVHLALLGMYERTEQDKLADELLDKMMKKYKHSCKVWLRRVQRMLKNQQDGVQSVVQRALLCLPRHKHIKFISQTAILEFKCGVPDRGRSMFEGILREYPKRTDLWSIYLDQEIRLGDADIIRSLFERAISLNLPLKKIKFLFKKYLAYEKTMGDEARMEYVKQKAMDYAESTRE